MTDGGPPTEGEPDGNRKSGEPAGPDEVPAPPLSGGDHPARQLLDLLGRAHALAILYYVARREQRPWRFTELQDELDVSPNTLSNRLAELTEAGLLERHSYDEIPPRVEYEATTKARELDPVFRDLYQWADRHWPEAAEGFDTDADA
jgi:DNA-binding HxlR family transcriptional regulator